MFSDQLLLQDVLARSDRAMAVVKDLFGDAPRRQSGRNAVLNRHVAHLFDTFTKTKFLFIVCPKDLLAVFL